MRVRVVAQAGYARVELVMGEQVAQPDDAATRRPCLLAVSVQTMDGDETAVLLAVHTQRSSKEHTRRLNWCLQLPLVGRVQLQQLALLTLSMLRGLPVSVRMRWKAA